MKHVFHKINGYPWWVIDQVSTSIQENINKTKSSEYYPDTSERPVEKMHSLIMAYAIHKGNTFIKTMNNGLKCFLPNNVKTRVHIQVKNLVQNSRLKIKSQKPCILNNTNHL